MSDTAASTTGFGVVAIARNEGDRLRRCLDSLEGLGVARVYVDSGSTDGSVELARSRGVEVVELDLSRPFTAARARNAGFERLLEIAPDTRAVMFLDGDCEVAEGWLDHARDALDARPRAAVVFGRRSERFPERSLYNRLADLEWNIPIGSRGPDGESEACGGDAVFRVDAFRQAGGFDPSVPAGEEPELCARLRGLGWSVARLDADMTWHDVALLRFGQWARRQFRTGYGGLDFSTRFGGGPMGDPFRGQIRSARVWTIGWTLALLVAVGVGLAVNPWVGLALGVLVLAAPLAQAARIGLRHRHATGSLATALAYGGLTLLGKWYQLGGQLLYLRDHRAGRHARLIEYKGPRPGASAPTSASG